MKYLLSRERVFAVAVGRSDSDMAQRVTHTQITIYPPLFFIYISGCKDVRRPLHGNLVFECRPRFVRIRPQHLHLVTCGNGGNGIELRFGG